MSGSKLFLDTNIILYVLNGDFTLADLLQDKQLYISIITEIELLAFKGITKKEEDVIRKFVSICKIVSITNSIKEETIKIRKSYNTKIPDSIIIASAIFLDLPLITADGDFKNVEDLILIHYEN